MGYGNPSLDEISDDVLCAELARRLDKLAAGICPYCDRDIATRPCLHGAQHKHAAHIITKPKADTTVGAVATLLERQT